MPMELGMVPDNVLPDRSSDANDDRLPVPRLSGMEPVSPPADSCNTFRDVMYPRTRGNEPLISTTLFESESAVSEVIAVIVAGMVPDNAL